MSEANRLRFFELAERYNQLGTMLPAPGDFNSDDIEAVATVRVVIAEMRAARQQMDAVLDAEMTTDREIITTAQGRATPKKSGTTFAIVCPTSAL